MSGLRRFALLCALCLSGGCATLWQPGPYEVWRDWYRTAMHMDEAGQARETARLEAIAGTSPSATTSLQLAYLLGHGVAGQRPADSSMEEAMRWLENVADGHELAPLRDLLREQLSLRQRVSADRQALAAAKRQCAASTRRLGELRDEQAALRTELATCADQLRALKEIESMMSAVERPLELQP